jgi:hypothetical protein
MPSIFIIDTDGDPMKKRKSMSKSKRSTRRQGLGAATGMCRMVRRADGRTQRLCKTTTGRWKFMPLKQR